MSNVKLHPSLDNGIQPALQGFTGGVLRCHCATDAVEVRVDSPTLHNHACGCSKCWKPAGAKFAVIAVAPRDAVTVLSNGQKLKIVDEAATIRRHACTECGVHMYGRIENKGHPFMAWTLCIRSSLKNQVGRPRHLRRSFPRSSRQGRLHSRWQAFASNCEA